MLFAELEHKVICMIVWNTEVKDDVHVYEGKIYESDGEYYFSNEEKGWKINLNTEQMQRIKPVSDELKATLLNADFAFPMWMAALPDSDSQNYNAIGLNWND